MPWCRPCWNNVDNTKNFESVLTSDDWGASATPPHDWVHDKDAVERLFVAGGCFGINFSIKRDHGRPTRRRASHWLSSLCCNRVTGDSADGRMVSLAEREYRSFCYFTSKNRLRRLYLLGGILSVAYATTMAAVSHNAFLTLLFYLGLTSLPLLLCYLMASIYRARMMFSLVYSALDMVLFMCICNCILWAPPSRYLTVTVKFGQVVMLTLLPSILFPPSFYFTLFAQVAVFVSLTIVVINDPYSWHNEALCWVNFQTLIVTALLSCLQSHRTEAESKLKFLYFVRSTLAHNRANGLRTVIGMSLRRPVERERPDANREYVRGSISSLSNRKLRTSFASQNELDEHERTGQTLNLLRHAKMADILQSALQNPDAEQVLREMGGAAQASWMERGRTSTSHFQEEEASGMRTSPRLGSNGIARSSTRLSDSLSRETSQERSSVILGLTSTRISEHDSQIQWPPTKGSAEGQFTSPPLPKGSIEGEGSGRARPPPMEGQEVKVKDLQSESESMPSSVSSSSSQVSPSHGVRANRTAGQHAPWFLPHGPSPRRSFNLSSQRDSSVDGGTECGASVGGEGDEPSGSSGADGGGGVTNTDAAASTSRLVDIEKRFVEAMGSGGGAASQSTGQGTLRLSGHTPDTDDKGKLKDDDKDDKDDDKDQNTDAGTQFTPSLVARLGLHKHTMSQFDDPTTGDDASFSPLLVPLRKADRPRSRRSEGEPKAYSNVTLASPRHLNPALSRAARARFVRSARTQSGQYTFAASHNPSRSPSPSPRRQSTSLSLPQQTHSWSRKHHQHRRIKRSPNSLRSVHTMSCNSTVQAASKGPIALSKSPRSYPATSHSLLSNSSATPSISPFRSVATPWRRLPAHPLTPTTPVLTPASSGHHVHTPRPSSKNTHASIGRPALMHVPSSRDKSFVPDGPPPGAPSPPSGCSLSTAPSISTSPDHGKRNSGHRARFGASPSIQPRYSRDRGKRPSTSLLDSALDREKGGGKEALAELSVSRLQDGHPSPPSGAKGRGSKPEGLSLLNIDEDEEGPPSLSRPASEPSTLTFNLRVQPPVSNSGSIRLEPTVPKLRRNKSDPLVKGKLSGMRNFLHFRSRSRTRPPSVEEERASRHFLKHRLGVVNSPRAGQALKKHFAPNMVLPNGSGKSGKDKTKRSVRGSPSASARCSQSSPKLLDSDASESTARSHLQLSGQLRANYYSPATVNLAEQTTAFAAIDNINRWVARVRDIESGRHRKKKFDVFLGGSCNPTTWRRDIAIPILERHRVTFYNPQVDTWTPELVAVEAQAKEDAEFLLFVVDGRTRALSSMMECCEYICSGVSTIVVIINVDVQACFFGVPADEAQIKDLNRARRYVMDVADRHGVSVFRSVQEALDQILALVKERKRRDHKQKILSTLHHQNDVDALFDEGEDFQDLCTSFKSISMGIELRDRTVGVKMYSNTFVGDAAVAWLLKYFGFTSRPAAVQIGEAMRCAGLFSHVHGSHKALVDANDSFFHFNKPDSMTDAETTSVLQNIRDNLPLHDYAHMWGKSYRNCFKASDFVTFLVATVPLRTRSRAVRLARLLAAQRYIRHVGSGNSPWTYFNDDSQQGQVTAFMTTSQASSPVHSSLLAAEL